MSDGAEKVRTEKGRRSQPSQQATAGPPRLSPPTLLDDSQQQQQPLRSPLVSAISATVSSILQPFQLQNMLPGFLGSTTAAPPPAAATASASAVALPSAHGGVLTLGMSSSRFSKRSTGEGATQITGDDKTSTSAGLELAERAGANPSGATSGVEGADAFQCEPVVLMDALAAPAATNETLSLKRDSHKAKKGQRHHGKMGKSRTAPTTAAMTAASLSSAKVSVSTASAKFSVSLPNHRRPSSSSASSKGKAKRDRTASVPAIETIPVDDPAPLRVVDPLVGLPMEHQPLQVPDLWNLVDAAYFPLADTHSVAYLARLLGYRGVKPTVPPNRTNTPVRFVRSSLDSYPQDPIYALPRAGTLGKAMGEGGKDEDEAQLVMERNRSGKDSAQWDPLYISLIERYVFSHNSNDEDVIDVTMDVSAAQLAKLNSVLVHNNAKKVTSPEGTSCTAGFSPLQATVEMAIELGILARGHSVALVSRGEPAGKGEHQMGGSSGGDNCGGAATHGARVAAADPRDEAACTIALYQSLGDGEPVAWASYAFRWYPITTNPPHQYELILDFVNLRTKTASLLDSAIVERQDELSFIVMAACALEHARMNNVHYAVAPVAACLARFFRMIGRGGKRLVCDLHKCSARYAFLKYREATTVVPNPSTVASEAPGCHRWLVQLPMATELKRRWSASTVSLGRSCTSAFIAVPTTDAPHVNDAPGAEATTSAMAPAEAPKTAVMSTSVVSTLPLSMNALVASLPVPSTQPVRKPNKKKSTSVPVTKFSSGSMSAQSGIVSVSAQTTPEGHFVVSALSSKACAESRGIRSLSEADTDPIQLQLLRDFRVQGPESDDDSELLRELKAQQDRLRSVETRLHGKTHQLMGCAVEERVAYERQAQERQRDRDALELHQRKLERQKQLDLAWQKQLEQDMDAVCDVCNDGEVTPDNQILFCEACNVAVHQMCYGVDKIPDGDYYCIACRYLGREQARVNHNGDPVPPTAPKPMPSPLPIYCELCPHKQGAYIRTDVKKVSVDDPPFGKWVHAVCAKWLGLDFVSVPDVLEDVTEWKKSFRRNRIKCYLCEGERGCMNRCSVAECNKWLHVTCARSVGTCQVIHGEDVRGAVTENPWTLQCPDHSNIKQENIPKGAVSVDSLVQLAKEFPSEPVPPPEAIDWKPFNTATGAERALLLNDKSYERCLLTELTTKNLFGVRCDVCEQEIDPKLRLRCQICDVIFCRDCSLGDIDGFQSKDNFRCSRCMFVSDKEKAGEEYETPGCIACYQKAGWLRKAMAKPYTKNGTVSCRKMGNLGSTYFGKQIWVHTLCTFWNPKLVLSVETGVVDCSYVVTVNGRGLIQAATPCFLCGNAGGLKVKCSHGGCAYLIGGKRTEATFHVTCAREAGLEVNAVDDGSNMKFYVKCYRHGGNEYNLRAKLEDMLEVEKRRSGKLLARSDAPMKFSHASRLLHSAMGILRVLGWAWQWAEQWVDYNSSWEPLLEPGEKEEEMTKEQLKIVYSTRESRCEAARSCRLAAFGAALRNRSFDTEDDFDRATFHRAILSILRTESLVGPLLDNEIEFYCQWLALAYWSKSRYLGIGDSKIEVNPSSSFCLHIKDKSPKFELGSRPLPGRYAESDFDEIDNFMLSEVITDEMLDSLRHLPCIPTPSKRTATTSSDRLRRSRSSQNDGVDVDVCSTIGNQATDTADSSKPTPTKHSAGRTEEGTTIVDPSAAVSRRHAKQSSGSLEKVSTAAPGDHEQSSRATPPREEKRVKSPPKRFSAEAAANSQIVQEVNPTNPSSPSRRRESSVASPSSYDQEAVRRARRPPYLNQESSSDGEGPPIAPSCPAEVKKRGKGRPPKLATVQLFTVPSTPAESDRPNCGLKSFPDKKRKGRPPKKLPAETTSLKNDVHTANGTLKEEFFTLASVSAECYGLSEESSKSAQLATNVGLSSIASSLSAGGTMSKSLDLSAVAFTSTEGEAPTEESKASPAKKRRGNPPKTQPLEVDDLESLMGTENKTTIDGPDGESNSSQFASNIEVSTAASTSAEVGGSNKVPKSSTLVTDVVLATIASSSQSGYTPKEKSKSRAFDLSTVASTSSEAETPIEESKSSPANKRRGRPPKKRPADVHDLESQMGTESETARPMEDGAEQTRSTTPERRRRRGQELTPMKLDDSEVHGKGYDLVKRRRRLSNGVLHGANDCDRNEKMIADESSREAKAADCGSILNVPPQRFEASSLTGLATSSNGDLFILALEIDGRCSSYASVAASPVDSDVQSALAGKKALVTETAAVSQPQPRAPEIDKFTDANLSEKNIHDKPVENGTENANASGGAGTARCCDSASLDP